MRSKIGKLSLRILFIPIVGLFVLQLFSVFGRSLNNLVYNLTDDSKLHVFLRFDTREFIILWISLFWLVSLFVLEICAAFRENFNFRRLLTNMRYAPIFMLIFSSVIVIAFDLGMIEHSKWKIRNYVYNSSDSIEKPELKLHVDYRGWCGNGYSARESDLYFDVAAEGLTDENPKVRARAFLMTLSVRDFFNGGDEAKLDKVLRKTCGDADLAVRNLAEAYLENTGCEKYLSSE